MRKTKDIHLKLDLSTLALLDRYAREHCLARNRLINQAVETYMQLQKLHGIYLQYQELGCNLEEFRSEYCQYDLGELTWLLQPK